MRYTGTLSQEMDLLSLDLIMRYTDTYVISFHNCVSSISAKQCCHPLLHNFVLVMEIIMHSR